MKIGIATDHNGVNEKKELINYIQSLGYQVIDCSPINTPTDDYPRYAEAVATKIQNKEIDKGILLCGTGIGMSIAANKFKGIRCGHISSDEDVILAVEHNDVNIISLSYKRNIEELKSYIKIFIEKNFSFDERHIRRLAEITEIEERNA